MKNIITHTFFIEFGMKYILLLLCFLLSIAAFAQKNYPTRDSIHIFWQPGLLITYEDYAGDTITEVMDLMRIYHFSASASIGLWSVMDIPEKSKDRRRKTEQIYIAPAFERTTSFALTNDATEIAIQNTYLDICEIWGRYARERFAQIRDSSATPGTLAFMFKKVMDQMEAQRLDMTHRFSREVIVEKKPGAFEGWRNLISETLVKTEKWATKPEECYRHLTGVPLIPGYILAPPNPESQYTAQNLN